MPKPIDFYRLFPVLFAVFIWIGCIPAVPQKAYYVSPLNGNNQAYQPLPLQQDSVHTAVYGGGSFFSGSANEHGTDYFNGGRLALSAAHHYGMMQFFYGVDGTLGSYTLGTWRDGYSLNNLGVPTTAPLHSDSLNSISGPKTFGSVGFHGGVNGVIPVRGGEWRFLGLEMAFSREFGDYLSLRKRLADSLADLDIRSPLFGTLALTSEMIGRTRNGEFGFKLSEGWVLGHAYRSPHVFDNLDERYLSYGYFAFSFHYTCQQYTGYLQLSTGEKATAIQLGLQYRLTRSRLPPKAGRYPNRQP
jgi:hypothetical protein